MVLPADIIFAIYAAGPVLAVVTEKKTASFMTGEYYIRSSQKPERKDLYGNKRQGF